MKPRQLFFPVMFLLVLAGLRVAAEQGQLDPSSNPRFTQSRSRIDALFHFRNAPPPAPDLRQNPFRVGNETASSANAGNTANATPLVPDSDEGMLHQGAGTLKIGGLVVRDGSTQIGINGGLYKEGDVIPARVHGTLVYFRIRHISPEGITLSLNDAEITLPAHK